MEALAKLWHERHVDWSPILGIIHSETGTATVQSINGLLAKVGWPTPYPNAEQWALGFGVSLGTLMLYFILFGRRHRMRSQGIESDLAKAKAKVAKLEQQLHTARASESRGKGKQIRIWMDGAFDMLHYGHMNAFRQGRAHGTQLVVGVNSDESIKECKGTAPVMNDAERLAAVQGCKFVDEVIPECPYVMDDDYLAMIFEKLKIDYVVHGDDPCIVDGKNVYQNAIDLGKYRTIPRTEGVSTTDIVGRMLMFSKEHHDMAGAACSNKNGGTLVSTTKKMMNRPSNFLTTSNFIQLFSQPARIKPKDAKVIYIDGAWDMFHSGHINTLERARAMGDYLIVGVVNDETVNRHRGANYPIMNLNERVLSVVACRHADDVLIDAPWEITEDMIKSLGIHTVVAGSTHDENSAPEGKEIDCYAVPKQMGIFREIKSESSLTVTQIVSRILAKEQQYRAKYEKKTAAEEEYYKDRYAANAS